MEEIGGYRIIRKLGGGSRAEVFLGRADRAGESSAQQVAIKVYRASASRGESASRGAAAEWGVLSAVEHRHLVRLLDLAAGPNGEPSLILERLEPHGVSHLLAQGGEFSAGEAVTILAPLADAVGVLHRAGFSHGAITAHHVLLDAQGAPVLIGFGGASVIEVVDGRARVDGSDRGRQVPGVVLEADAGVQQDLRDLAVLSESVLARVTPEPVRYRPDRQGASPVALREWLRAQCDRPRSDRFGADFTAELADRVFDLAEPTVVRPFTVAAPDGNDRTHRAVPVRTQPGPVRQAGMAPLGDPHRSGRLPSSPTQPRWRVTIQDWLGRGGAVDDAIRAGARLLGRLRSALATVRRRVWVAGVVGMVAITVAVTLAMPADDGGSGLDSGIGTTGTGITDDLTVSEVTPIGGDVGAAVMGDDPVQALTVLLSTRERCIAELSLSCLEQVDQAGGSAFEADASYVRMIRDGASAEVPSLLTGSSVLTGPSMLTGADTVDLRLVDRFGDSALLATSSDSVESDISPHNATASILVIRTEAGWRIRSITDTSSQSVG